MPAFIRPRFLCCSDRNPLNQVPRHLPLPAVIQSCRSRVSVAQKVLHLFQRNVLLEQVGGDGHAERMGRDPVGEISGPSGGVSPSGIRRSLKNSFR